MVDRLVNSEANARRIAMVENCFGSSGQPLKVPGRVLVGEGVLTKICRKKPKPRQFFLFNDVLVYGTILINKKKYNQQHLIPLEDVKLENLEDDGHLRNGWLIRTSQKSFAVYAATATEKSEWMAHLNKCIQDLLKKSGKRASTEHAAVWIPDAEASVCMHCKKTMFNMLNRRHHCRKCGAVVCGPCSAKKLMLPSQASKPLRVCLSCFDANSKATQNQPEKVIEETKEEIQESSGDDSDNDADSEEGNLDIDDVTEKPMFYGHSVESTVRGAPPKRPPPPRPTSAPKEESDNSEEKKDDEKPEQTESTGGHNKISDAVTGDETPVATEVTSPVAAVENSSAAPVVEPSVESPSTTIEPESTPAE